MKRQKKQQPSLKLSSLEQNFFQQGYKRIVGIDEVGRGCIAGPLVVGAFILEPESDILDGVNDSKVLSKKTRETLEPLLSQSVYKLYEISPQEIDALSLGQSFRNIIHSIFEDFFTEETIFILDGNLRFPDLKNFQSIIDGDATHYSIASASILAKVYRDNLMARFAMDHPGYGFEKHVGYATKSHINAIKTLGYCDIHRRSFQLNALSNQLELI